MANQVGDGRKELKQKYFQKDSAIKKLIKHATSPKSLGLVICAFRKSCIQTNLFCMISPLAYLSLHILHAKRVVIG
jgi:hypothetical protein